MMLIVCFILAIVAACNWTFNQLNKHKEFLRGDSHEEMYMSLRFGLQKQGENLACRLNK